MTCIIIDDEPIAHHIIEDYAKELKDLTILKSFYNAVEAISFLNTNKVDFIFLDIKMPKLKGLDFIKMLTHPPAIIITSAYEEYALEGFELSVTDYLLKPFSFERFLKAYQKVAQLKTNISNTNVKVDAEDQSIFIKGDKEIHQVNLNNIIYLESYGGYVKVHLNTQKPIVVHQSLKFFETNLNTNFIRTHRSYIINKTYIKSIKGNLIKLQDNDLPIGKLYKIHINKLLEN
ncbi:LytR/AlgR family response regulator transcription factor [Winogradskyella immobilis]|uniref:Response regulator transcription factor n=1 Tax=Winogradskyella immobilis TaxID=2816852 RepID=A0ABS8EMK1_9FLAO|nr:LytTR family DNA-binding domain-containing protein [Winogradskyella immobilis]MCC1483537.1 response regulator transcription factor [Winogradskyella immobilis]MCG0015631.1 LytTR family DNA-binding domain-containing protein [Winogradskyella immobilis]